MATAPENKVVSDTDERTKPPFLRRVRIRGYKSIAFCDVTLEPLTILVGRNASGKSNFIDALAFLQDAMATNITEAAKRHGGWHYILSRFSQSGEISFEVEVSLPPTSLPPLMASDASRLTAEYGVVLKEGPSGSPVLLREWFQVRGAKGDGNPHFDLRGTYDPDRKIGDFDWQFHHPHVPCSQVPHPRPDRLWIGSFGEQPFLDVSDGLRCCGYHNFNPEAIRRFRRPAPGEFLERDGGNLASTIETTRENEAEAIERVGRYLSVITGSVELNGVFKFGDYETAHFRVLRNEGGPPMTFEAASMSDGTLRALASLVAAFQVVLPYGYPSLIAIEEPETSLHPAAMRALVDALDEATGRTQILLTTHSAELLDNPTVQPENVRVVEMIDGQTVIAPVDEASVAIVRRKLNTLGGLERDNQLEPNLDDLERQQLLGQSRQEPPG
jgi:predicted ATPase